MREMHDMWLRLDWIPERSLTFHNSRDLADERCKAEENPHRWLWLTKLEC